MPDELNISAELNVCSEKIAILDRMLSALDPTDTASVECVKGRITEWTEYQAGLRFVRDRRPSSLK
jgi:hypothetical protein